jgi:hypothetical protein
VSQIREDNEAAYKRGWEDREADLLCNVNSIYRAVNGQRVNDAVVEKVAKAIFAADSTDADWRWQEGRWEANHPADDHEKYRVMAKFAIKALLGDAAVS